MAQVRGVILVPAICAVLVMSTAAAPLLWAEPIVEFKSQSRIIPLQQGWVHNGICLSESCPGVRTCESQDTDNLPCYYQGWGDYDFRCDADNNCVLGIGCLQTSLDFSEHYNSPPRGSVQAVDGTCTFSEWIAFDNGVNQAAHRLLTITDSLVGGSPPYGAPTFLRAPLYPALRVVTGDGNLVANSLPVHPSGWPNNRNTGRARIDKTFELTGPGTQAVTLVCNVAAGPRLASSEFVRVDVFGRRFTFGVDGNPASPQYGRLIYGDDNNGNVIDTIDFEPVIVSNTVVVAQPQQGGTSGEFFTLRAVLRDDGSFDAYMNESICSKFTGQVTFQQTSGNQISLTPEEGDETMWIDYVQLFEGEVPPSHPNLVFDIIRDDIVDEADFAAFMECATGPANATGTWDTMCADCRWADVNQDNSIDMEDFAVFQRSPNLTWCTPVVLQNGNFEGGNANGIAAGWTGYTRYPVPDLVAYTIQTANPAEGLQYQQIQTSLSTGGAGVYQIVNGCIVGATYRIQGYFRTNSAHGRATVKCDPYGGTSYYNVNVTHLSPAAATVSTTWQHFNGTVTAKAPTMTIFLDSQTHDPKASGAKAAAFDGISITGCTMIPSP